MKFTTILSAATALVASVSAQDAVVKNSCTFTVYVQSFPYDGSAAGPLTTVEPGQSFSEAFRPSGSTIKLATTRTLTDPLFFGYSFSSNPDYAYYEFSTRWGNPFAQFPNSLGAGAGCESFDCGANDAACYSTPSHSIVYGCPLPLDLTADLCA